MVQLQYCAACVFGAVSAVRSQLRPVRQQIVQLHMTVDHMASHSEGWAPNKLAPDSLHAVPPRWQPVTAAPPPPPGGKGKHCLEPVYW